MEFIPVRVLGHTSHARGAHLGRTTALCTRGRLRIKNHMLVWIIPCTPRARGQVLHIYRSGFRPLRVLVEFKASGREQRVLYSVCS